VDQGESVYLGAEREFSNMEGPIWIVQGQKWIMEMQREIA